MAVSSTYALPIISAKEEKPVGLNRRQAGCPVLFMRTTRTPGRSETMRTTRTTRTMKTTRTSGRSGTMRLMGTIRLMGTMRLMRHQDIVRGTMPQEKGLKKAYLINL